MIQDLEYEYGVASEGLQRLSFIQGFDKDFRRIFPHALLDLVVGFRAFTTRGDLKRLHSSETRHRASGCVWVGP